ncbi:MAG TPA: hypothetical protein VFR90_00435 [Methylibium sp.]|uniref:hypothetical protein n=1 Tax=Methylibium sp. TaxID=2067992 RepID=UPI002DB580AB|nr:hypothetical protein [Methylibium sp.]HEU4457571.1 hypothetical protein [Methylibium sp.]
MDVVLQWLSDSPSLVAWFALLVIVFAVFIGLGLYATSHDDADELPPERPAGPDRRRPRPQPASRPGSPRPELNHPQESR